MQIGVSSVFLGSILSPANSNLSFQNGNTLEGLKNLEKARKARLLLLLCIVTLILKNGVS